MSTKQQTSPSLADRLRGILQGIDKQKSADERGWWETAEGAAFGAMKLTELLAVIEATPIAPEGWPTQAMVAAGRSAAESLGEQLGTEVGLWVVFQAMLNAAPSTIDGWQLTPAEPDHRMLQAGAVALGASRRPSFDGVARDVFAAMLEAAPQPKPAFWRRHIISERDWSNVINTAHISTSDAPHVVVFKLQRSLAAVGKSTPPTETLERMASRFVHLLG